MNPAPFQLESSPTPSRESLAPLSCSGSLDLRLGCCMDAMKTFPDGHFDLAIVDPPYGIGMAANPVRQAHAPKAWDAAAPGAEYFAELRRVSKHQIVWGANHFIERLPINSACWIVWDKQQPHDFSLAAAELAWTSFSSPCKKFTARPMEPNRIHPTQKPVELYRWLLDNYAKPGQRVLDTHMGSGSIAIAAHYFGAHLVACEIDPEYFAAATARIDRETRQTELFSPLNS
jgi:site-specific DNA-methyltransferase (adenine-specific)